MSVQVNAYLNSNIGRMFARQNAPITYGQQKTSLKIETSDPGGTVDTVSLSRFVPKPLPADYLEDAIAYGKEIASGGKLSQKDTERVRLDRVFTALVALEALGDNGETMPRMWPAGLPVPSEEELEEARRRLAQRLQDVDLAADAEYVQSERLRLLEKVGRRGTAGSGGEEGGAMAAAKAV